MTTLKTTILKSVIIFVIKIYLVQSYPGGAPSSTCNSMKPVGHGGSAQNSPVPFQLAPEEQIIEVCKLYHYFNLHVCPSVCPFQLIVSTGCSI